MRKLIILIGILMLMVVLIALSVGLLERPLLRWLFPPTPPLPTQEVLPDSSEGEGLIAFESTRDGNPEIYVMQADGTEPQNLTNDPAWDVSPKWSPDGQQLAFISNRTGKFEIFVMDATSAQLRQLTNDPEAAWGGIKQGSRWILMPDSSQLAWSPDGTRLAATHVLLNPTDHGWKESQIYLVNVDGSGTVPLTNARSNDFSPRWAPQGQQIAFLRQQYTMLTLMVVNADGVELLNLGADAFIFDWSPDGSRLAYVISQANNPPDEIWVVRTDDGSPPKRLLQSDGGFAGSQTTLVWSPDGTRLALVALAMMNDQFTQQLYLFWSDGSGLLRVTDALTVPAAPVWSRDGQSLAFELRQEGATDIYRLNVSDIFHSSASLETIQLTDTGKDRNPQWQP